MTHEKKSFTSLQISRTAQPYNVGGPHHSFCAFCITVSCRGWLLAAAGVAKRLKALRRSALVRGKSRTGATCHAGIVRACVNGCKSYRDLSRHASRLHFCRLQL